MNYRNFIFTVLLLLTFGIGQGWAITILVQDFEEVVKESPFIIEATVKDVEFYIIPNSALGYAIVTLSVQDLIKGTCPNEIMVRRYGVNDRFEYLDTEYAPVYFAQKKYILCLKKHPQGYYKPLGLFNGTFTIENEVIAGRGISVEEFKQQIRDILDGKSDSSSQFLKSYNESYILKKDNSSNIVTLVPGSHMNGQFYAQNQTWDTNYLPVKFYYNPDGAPADISTVIARINNAFTPWNDLSLSALDFQTITTSDITSEKQVQNTTNVIFWIDYTSGILAAEFTNPNTPQGPNTIKGSDILFNTDYNTGSPKWYFGSSPLSNRQGDYDFADILVHELGHSQGLGHTSINSTRMVDGYQNCTVSPLRTIADGDKAGSVYQHTGFANIPTTFPHSIAISATKSSFNITANVTVGSGKTFEIDPGMTIKGNFYTKITVNGTLNAIGTSSNHITFQKSGSSNWYGLEFNNAWYQSKVKYCTIKDAIYGIYMYNSDITIEYNDIYDIQIAFLKFVNGSDGGFGMISHNEIHDGGEEGVEFYSYSDPLFTYNEVYDTDGTSFYGDNTCCFSLGTYSTHGQNAIYNSGEMDVESDYNSTLYALYNWWGSSSPNPWVTWNIDWDPYLTYNPLAKRFTGSLKDRSKPNGLFTEQDTVGMPEVAAAALLYHDGKYDEAAVLFENLTNKYPDHFAGRRSLAFLYKCYKRSKSRDLVLLNLADFAAKSEYPELSALAQHFTVGELIKDGDYQTAIEMSTSILSEQKVSDYAKYALYNLGTIYYYFLEDRKTGETYFREFLKKYPIDVLTPSVLSTLDEPLMKEDKGETRKITADVFGNYPNPFNPKTTITYFVQEPGEITLKVYNILGEEVAVLVNKHQNAGRYEVIFDASHLPSGTYCYRIAGDGIGMVEKMILLR